MGCEISVAERGFSSSKTCSNCRDQKQGFSFFIALLNKVRYALCSMPYALCPMP
uniref:hypothetical protein n=1 Tax=Microcoleus sp. TaxID=44472 RepID=UPI00403EB383